MCVTPRTIINPNYGKQQMAAFHKDITSQYIKVPCGYCDECIANKQMQLIQRLQVMSMTNYLYYATLTYNKSSLRHITTSTGYDIPYADYTDIQKMIKLLRKHNDFGRDFSYYCVSEKGTKKGRPHFHLIFLVPKYSTDDKYTPFNLEVILWESVFKRWSRNVGTSRKPKYKPNFTYNKQFYGGKVLTNYDLHYVQDNASQNGCADVGFYVIKYMLKPSAQAKKLQQALRLNLPEDEYRDVWNLVRPRSWKSHNFGLPLNTSGDVVPEVVDYIKSGIHADQSKPYPTFVNPVSGQLFPLSRYYRNKADIYTKYDLDRVFLRTHEPDELIVAEPDDLNEYERKEKFISKQRKEIILDSKHDITDLFAD